MLRRWSILLAMLALTAGTAAFAANSASAATAGTPHVVPGGVAHLVSPGGSARGAAVSHQAESTNWSGYAATSGTYNSVSASWTEPTGHCSSGNQYSSFWVGLDGYNSSSVEQTGSEVDCQGSRAVYYAWYEMYPNPSYSYSSTVRPGDHFNASVTYQGSNRYSLHIADTTEGWSHTTIGTLSGAPRSSAEVIIEAPCCTSSGGILPLADFGTASFTGSMANGGALGSAGGVTQIIMVNNSGQPKDSISSLTNGENFSGTWIRSN